MSIPIVELGNFFLKFSKSPKLSFLLFLLEFLLDLKNYNYNNYTTTNF